MPADPVLRPKASLTALRTHVCLKGDQEGICRKKLSDGLTPTSTKGKLSIIPPSDSIPE